MHGTKRNRLVPQEEEKSPDLSLDYRARQDSTTGQHFQAVSSCTDYKHVLQKPTQPGDAQELYRPGEAVITLMQ